MTMEKKFLNADEKLKRHAAFGCACWMLLTLFVCGLRYRSGAHYMPVGVELGAGTSGEVWLRSPFGTEKKLQSIAHTPHLHIPVDYETGPIDYIIIRGVSAGEAKVAKVLVGESWESAQIVPIQKLTPLKEGTLLTGFQCHMNHSHCNFAKTPRRTINWGGDLPFFAYCGMVSLSLLFLGRVVWKLGFRCVGQCNADRNSRWLCCVCRDACLVLCLAFCLIHVWSSLQGVVEARDAVGGCCLLAVFLVTGLVISRFDQVAIDEPHSQQWLCAVTVALVLVACRAATAGRIPWCQSGDYGTYVRLGGLMVQGDWQALSNGYHANLIQSMRALLIGYPAALFGEYASEFVFVANNVILSALFFWLVFSDEEAVAFRWRLMSASCGMLYSDLLFGSYLCRHDVPALLLLVAVSSTFFSLFLRDSGGRPAGGQWRSVSLVGILGVLVGLLEVQRSLFPFVAIGGTWLVLPLLSRQPRKVFAWFGSLGVAILFCGCVRWGIESKSGQLSSASVLDSINAVETGQSGWWQDLEPWLLYYTNESGDWNQFEFFIRKLVLEKVVQFPRFLSGAISKISILSGGDGILRKTGAMTPGEQFPSNYLVPYFGLKKLFGNCVYFGLLVLMGVRCLCLGGRALRPLELLPLSFSVVLVLLIVLLGEAAEQYDLFLIVSLCLNMRMVLGQSQADVQAFACHRLFEMFTPVAIGVCALGSLCVAVWVSGLIVGHHEELFFAEPIGSVQDGGCEVVNGRFAYGIHVATWGGGRDRVGGSFLFRRDSFRGDRVRFILSADQRRKGTLYALPRWLNSDLQVRVRVGDIIVYEGVAGSLSKARFVSTDLQRGMADVKIQLEVFSASGTERVSLIEDVTVVVEYVH